MADAGVMEGTDWTPEGRFCPHCGSTNTREEKNRKPMPFRRKDCRGHFSVKHGTVMQSSRLGLQMWAIGIYLATGIKGTASMKIYRDIGLRQATAWFLMQRIREGFMGGIDKPFPGPVEADETAIGGKDKNMSNKKRKERKEAGIGRRSAGKAIVAGVKDRETRKVSMAVVRSTNAKTLQAFVTDRTEETATVYTDEAGAYKGIDRAHESVNHSAHEYVRVTCTRTDRGPVEPVQTRISWHVRVWVKKVPGRYCAAIRPAQYCCQAETKT
ncbi:MAG: IS1595 family transposase [Albidovulum sp.]|nr:IS1595 family transposase [Albidovulum sp.]